MPHQWNESARLRAQQIESGLDLTFSKVFLPYFRDQLQKLKPNSLLEIGGGTGHLCKALTDLTSRYVLLEPSEGMHAVAHEVLSGLSVHIVNESIEVFSSCNERFDLILSHMCVQTAGNLEAFAKALAQALDPNGMYLLSLPHPAFYNEYKEFFPPQSFSYIEERYASVCFSITLDPTRKIAAVPYYHRPLSTYVAALASAGLCVEILDEIFPDPQIQNLYGERWKRPRYVVIGGRLCS